MLKKLAGLTALSLIACQLTFAQERDFRKERAELDRAEREAKKNKTERVSSSYGTNILRFSPFSVGEGGIGIGISYEKIFGADKNIGFIIPIDILVDPDNYDAYNDNTNNAYVVFSPGIKIYPFGQKRVTYAIGPNAMLALGGGERWQYNNNGVYELTDHHVVKVGIFVNNYLNIQFTPNFNFGVQGGLGVKYIDRDYYSNSSGDSEYRNGMNITGDFSITLGYRF